MLSKKNRPTCITLQKFYYGTLSVPFPLQDTICALDFPENQTSSIFYVLSPIFKQRIRKKDLLQKKMHTRLKTTQKPKKFYHFRLILQIMLRLKIFSNMDSDTFNLFKR